MWPSTLILSIRNSLLFGLLMVGLDAPPEYFDLDLFCTTDHFYQCELAPFPVMSMQDIFESLATDLS